MEETLSLLCVPRKGMKFNMIKIKFIKEQNKSVAYDDNYRIGECDFIETKDYWNIVHTEVDNSYQGKGIARKLVEIIIENAKENNKKIVADCSYAKKLLERNNKYMKIAKEMSIKGFKNNEGGPFGAVITDKEGNIIAEGNNRVLCDLDPTAHAEICTIREACKKLKTYDLSNYILYTSCEPCPMCLSAIIWSNIKEVYYGCTKEDAGNIGFRDDIIYKYLKGENKDLINLKQLDREECIKAFEEYSKNNGTIY